MFSLFRKKDQPPSPTSSVKSNDSNAMSQVSDESKEDVTSEQLQSISNCLSILYQSVLHLQEDDPAMQAFTEKFLKRIDVLAQKTDLMSEERLKEMPHAQALILNIRQLQEEVSPEVKKLSKQNRNTVNKALADLSCALLGNSTATLIGIDNDDIRSLKRRAQNLYAAIPFSHEAFSQPWEAVYRYLTRLQDADLNHVETYNHFSKEFSTLLKETYEKICNIFSQRLENVDRTKGVNEASIKAHVDQIKELKERIANGHYPRFTPPNQELLDFTNTVFALPQLKIRKGASSLKTPEPPSDMHCSQSGVRRGL